MPSNKKKAPRGWPCGALGESGDGLDWRRAVVTNGSDHRVARKSSDSPTLAEAGIDKNLARQRRNLGALSKGSKVAGKPLTETLTDAAEVCTSLSLLYTPSLIARQINQSLEPVLTVKVNVTVWLKASVSPFTSPEAT